MIADQNWPDWCADTLRWRGRVLPNSPKAHWCEDWDGLPVSEDTPEIGCCTCYQDDPEFPLFGFSHEPKMRFGVLLRWGSFWVGAHWAGAHKRLCVTVWVVWPGGDVP